MVNYAQIKKVLMFFDAKLIKSQITFEAWHEIYDLFDLNDENLLQIIEREWENEF
jgi:hypothetical protein